MHIGLREGCAKLGVQRLVGRAEDEVHDLGGCVDDSQRLGGPGEAFSKELLVEFNNDALFAFGVVDAGRAHAH